MENVQCYVTDKSKKDLQIGELERNVAESDLSITKLFSITTKFVTHAYRIFHTPPVSICRSLISRCQWIYLSRYITPMLLLIPKNHALVTNINTSHCTCQLPNHPSSNPNFASKTHFLKRSTIYETASFFTLFTPHSQLKVFQSHPIRSFRNLVSIFNAFTIVTMTGERHLLPGLCFLGQKWYNSRTMQQQQIIHFEII